MNWDLVVNTVHRVLGRLLAAALIIGYSLYMMVAWSLPGALTDAAARALDLSQPVAALVWVLGAGLIGSDVSSGSLALLLSRPLSRTRYVLSRWAGLVLSVLGVHYGLLILVLSYHAAAGSYPFSAAMMANAFLAPLLIVVCHACLLALLSSLLPGVGDSSAYLGAYVLFGFALMALDRDSQKLLSTLFGWFALPGSAALSAGSDGKQSLAFALSGVYLAVAGLELGLATLILEERDLSYVNR